MRTGDESLVNGPIHCKDIGREKKGGGGTLYCMSYVAYKTVNTKGCNLEIKSCFWRVFHKQYIQHWL